MITLGIVSWCLSGLLVVIYELRKMNKVTVLDLFLITLIIISGPIALMLEVLAYGDNYVLWKRRK